MGVSLVRLDLKKESKELKPTSKCFKDYISSLKKTGNCEPTTVNGYGGNCAERRNATDADRSFFSRTLDICEAVIIFMQLENFYMFLLVI